MTENVPYRLQAPFLDLKTNDWNVGKKQLIDRINAYYRLIYKFDQLDGLNTRIHFDERWSEYIVKNQVIIKGCLKYNLVEYLQRRNPNVPGVIDKLYPPQERKLLDIQKYWKLIMTVSPVVEIYGNGELNVKDISIDHFVPWSYVANDEIKNTMKINSNRYWMSFIRRLRTEWILGIKRIYIGKLAMSTILWEIRRGPIISMLWKMQSVAAGEITVEE